MTDEFTCWDEDFDDLDDLIEPPEAYEAVASEICGDCYGCGATLYTTYLDENHLCEECGPDNETEITFAAHRQCPVGDTGPSGSPGPVDNNDGGVIVDDSSTGDITINNNDCPEPTPGPTRSPSDYVLDDDGNPTALLKTNPEYHPVPNRSLATKHLRPSVPRSRCETCGGPLPNRTRDCRHLR